MTLQVDFDCNRLEYAVVKLTKNMNSMNHKQTWNAMSEDSLWVELVACLLGSGVAFEHAQSIVKDLSEKGLLEVQNLSIYREFETNIHRVLLERSYRFPKIRAEYIRNTAEMIYGEGLTITELLYSTENINETRSIIMKHAKGIGPKQSSMFLRNIGFSDDLAILDSHVLKYMFSVGLLDISIKTVSNMSIYKILEERLKEYSSYLQVKLSSLDTAIWVVMRVLQRGYAG